MLSNAELLQRLDRAFKQITVGDLNDGVLQPQKFAQFVRSMQLQTAILDEARFIEMDAHKVDIDRTGFGDRILTEAVKEGETSVGSEDWKDPSFNMNQLVAAEFRAKTGIKDRALRRNIERGNFEDTLVSLFGEAAGRDLEETAILGATDTDDLPFSWDTGDEVLGAIDGWVFKAEHIAYKDEVDENDPEDIFSNMLAELPKRYLRNPSDWRFYAPWDTVLKYQSTLAERGTVLGDQALTEALQLRYKGIPVVPVPILERSKDPGDGWGKVVILGHPDNMVWGVFHEVNVERYRNPGARQTEFYLTVEADAHYEDEEAAVVAMLDIEDSDDQR